jgi:iron(III) transport system ATP-binding protein
MSIAFEAIRHAYPERGEVLRGLSLAARPGEIVCLLGPSGCGKTTLLRLAAGLEPLQSGRISLAGETIAEPEREVPPEARGVGFVFQDYALFPHLTVEDNVAFGLRFTPRGQRKWRIMDALARVGLEAYAKAWPHMLSGGQQQRVALARALAPRPAVLLLDEAFASLDARLREQVRDDTLHVLQEAGIATLIVTHDAEEAMFMADRIALMNEGPHRAARHPGRPVPVARSRFVATFLGEVNRLPARLLAGRVETPIGAMDLGNRLPAAAAAGRRRRCRGAAAAGGAARARCLFRRRLAGGRRDRGGRGLPAARRDHPGPPRGRRRAGRAAAPACRLPPGVWLSRGEKVSVAMDAARAFVFPPGDTLSNPWAHWRGRVLPANGNAPPTGWTTGCGEGVACSVSTGRNLR